MTVPPSCSSQPSAMAHQCRWVAGWQHWASPSSQACPFLWATTIQCSMWPLHPSSTDIPSSHIKACSSFKTYYQTQYHNNKPTFSPRLSYQLQWCGCFHPLWTPLVVAEGTCALVDPFSSIQWGDGWHMPYSRQAHLLPLCSKYQISDHDQKGNHSTYQIIISANPYKNNG